MTSKSKQCIVKCENEYIIGLVSGRKDTEKSPYFPVFNISIRISIDILTVNKWKER